MKSGEEKSSEIVKIGKVVGAHGVKGELRVLPYVPGEDIEDFVFTTASGLETFLIKERAYTIKSLRPHKGRFIIIKVSELSRRDQAERLIGEEVEVSKEALGELPEGEFYEFELIGLDVYTDGGDYLGKLAEIISTGSNDVYEVVEELEGEARREVLLPAIDDVILNVDLDKRRITVHLLEGLIRQENGRKREVDRPCKQKR